MATGKGEQATIARMHALREEGLAYYRIVESLNAEGVPTRSRGRWHAQMVQRILTAVEARRFDVYFAYARFVMSENLHTSLPIEYQLQYGTPCGYLNGPNFVSNSAGNGVSGTYSALSQELLLCGFWI